MPAKAGAIISELQKMQPACPAFVDKSHDKWVAVVIRKTVLSENSAES